MASILRKPLKDGTTSWQAFVYVQGFPRISKTFDSRARAEEFAQAQELVLKQKKYATPTPITPETRTIDDLLKCSLGDLLAKHFLSERKCKSRHKRNARSVIALVGNANVADVSEYWVERFIEKVSATASQQGSSYAYSTIKDQLVMIRLAIGLEAKEIDVPRLKFPFSNAMLPQGWRVKRKRRLEKSEERALFGALRTLQGPRRHQWRLMVRLAIATGARLQELLRAEWSDINEPNMSWFIPARNVKTRQDRTVPLGARARRLIKQLRLIKDPSSDLVFPGMGTSGACSQQFRGICKRAAITNFRFHDLRHEAISRLYIYDRELEERHISVIVGHSCLDQTRDYVALRADEFALRMR
ncbi:site-specific integrase [Caballeronia sp. BR00000012568055]|uniref:site-specific integrase n=1 Tax=Caballeronia sp. BR00000012568055 TaxID=2918761 RepID=UPI0023FA32D6|nr:site-specific integrase [Caballeronia sp. BR00000012568055]